jgi:hypothetical protein
MTTTTVTANTVTRSTTERSGDRSCRIFSISTAFRSGLIRVRTVRGRQRSTGVEGSAAILPPEPSARRETVDGGRSEPENRVQSPRCGARHLAMASGPSGGGLSWPPTISAGMQRG